MHQKEGLEELREDLNLYLEEFEKTNSRADEIRLCFSVMRYYERLNEINPSQMNKTLYKTAVENFERILPSGKTNKFKNPPNPTYK